MDRPILAVAKVTSHIEDDPADVWIVKDKTYYLTPMYRFIDEQGDTHYLDMWEFENYFKKEDKHESSI